MRSAKLVELIKTTSITGNGTKENPVREITQYWDLKGNLLFTCDTDNHLDSTNCSASSEVNS